MVTPGHLIDSWSPAEFGGHNDQGRIQHAAAVEIAKECGQRLVERGNKEIAQAHRILPVGIPVAILNGNKSAAGLNQPTTHQAALSQAGHAIFFAGSLILAGNVKRQLGLLGGHQ